MPAVIDRCGVIAGPWQMGKVDQGVFTHWMLAHHFGNPLSYIGFGGEGKQVRDLLHVEDLVDLVERQLLDPAAWDGRTVNVGGGRECSLSLLRDDGDLPRADRQRGADRRRSRETRAGRRARYTFPTARSSSAWTSGARGAAPSRCSPTSTSGSPPTRSGSPRRSNIDTPAGGRE